MIRVSTDTLQTTDHNTSSLSVSSSLVKPHSNKLQVNERYKKVSVSVNWHKDGLGVSLRGGREYGIGLFISW